MIDDRLKVIADHYGLDGQLGILQEECAELIQAVIKYHRNGMEALMVEEMADVLIMIDQITYLLDASHGLDGIIQRKIGRQMKRITEEKQ